jgi:hypothetical protein
LLQSHSPPSDDFGSRFQPGEVHCCTLHETLWSVIEYPIRATSLRLIGEGKVLTVWAKAGFGMALAQFSRQSPGAILRAS